MFRQPKRKLFVAVVISLLSLSPMGTNAAQQEAIANCDALAAHPGDPDSQADGVEDGTINTTAAIASCEEALSANPDDPRLQFQLGRAFWEADRDAEAIELFGRAAIDGDYAAAYAFLGIAYEYGYATGRPETVLARSLYQVALERGFEPAVELLGALAPARPMNDPSGADEMDFSGYYQPDILRNIYEEHFEELNQEPLKVVLYLRGMYDFFKQEVNWFDLRCAHLHDTRLTQKVIRNLTGAGAQTAISGADAVVGRIFEEVQARLQNGDLAGLVTGYMETQILPDEGKRDAGRLVSDHDNNCEAEAIKRLYKNAQYYFLREMSFI